MERIILEIWQDGMCVASVDALERDAINEARHYAMMYGQDGPVECFRYKPRTGERDPILLQPNV